MQGDQRVACIGTTRRIKKREKEVMIVMILLPVVAATMKDVDIIFSPSLLAFCGVSLLLNNTKDTFFT
jgi:hypothetical protein